MPQALNLERITAPALEPLSLNEVKQQLRLEDQDGEDAALIAGLIRAARQQAESYLGRALITQSWSLWLDRWPTEGKAWVALPRPPLQSVAFMKSYDEADAATVVPAADYFVDSSGEPGRVVLRKGVAAPEARRAAKGLEIRFNAGYGDDPHDVPEDIRAGLLLLIAHLYENRGDRPSGAMSLSGAAQLWQAHRVLRL